MTTTGPCEMSGPSPKFFGAGSKFPYVLYVSSSGPICLSGMIRGGGCHSTVKPVKKSFVRVMFQRSVSNLLHNVFCSFPKVSVINMVHRQKKGSNV